MNDASIQATFGDGYLFYKLKLGVKKYDIYYSLFQVFQKGRKIFEENPTGFHLYFFPEVFAAIRLPTSRAAFICAVFAAPIP